MKHLFYSLFFVLSLSASQHELEKVSLRLQWLDQFQFAGYYMAKENGFYEDEGLDVEIKKYAGNIDVVEDVLSGKSTYGIGRSGLVLKYAQGRDISLLSAIFQSSPFTLIALKSSGMNSVKDFAGKTIMVTKDAVQAASIHAMINISSANKDSIKYKDHTFDINELIDKKVDLYAGYMTNEPFFLEQKGIEYSLFSPKDMGFDFYSDILFTSGENVRKNPQAVERFRRASLKGWACAFKNIEQAVDIIYVKYNPTNKSKDALLFEAYELKKLAFANNSTLGAIEKNKIERILDVYRVMGLTEANVNTQNLIFAPNEKFLNRDEQRYLEQKGEIRICVSPASLPFSSIEHGEFIGIASDILSLTQESVKVPYKLVKTSSWYESLQNIKNKKCDIIPMVPNLPRHEGIKYTSPYHFEPLMIVTGKRQNYIIDVSSVMDKEFLINRSNPFVAGLREKYPNMKINYTDSLKDAFHAVEKGKYYGYIDDFVTIAYTFKNMPNANLKIAGQMEYNVALGFGVRDDDEMLLNIFEKLSKSIKDTEIRKIHNEWVSVNYIQSVKFEYVKESIFFILLVLFIFFYRQHILNKKNAELEKLKDELLDLNRTLESKVAETVAEIQKKDTYMLHKSRLAQMGEMISMIAHQWKQPLSTISTLNISMIMAIELEQYDLSKADQRAEFLAFLDDKLKKIGIHVQNLGQIITDFSDFYRPNKQQEFVTLNEPVLKSYWLLEGSLASKNIDLCLELGSKKMVRIFKNEFVQVIINIVNNAKEQFEEKRINDAQITIKSYDRDDDVAVLEISDNAGGIPEDIIENIFDPYFSTKFEKNGTGLGLHMSKNIVKQHYKGSISAQNIKGGAMFRIEIGIEKEE